MAKILLVEDDKNVASTVQQWLEHEHYRLEVVEDGVSALELLTSYEYDVVVLDVSLPRMSGFDVCKKYRESGGQARVLMLTGRRTVAEREEGLDLGADDYLTKPFDLKELSARIRALLRRPGAVKGNLLKAGDLILDPTAFKLTRDGKDIHLPKMEFALLEFLMRHPGQVFSSEALLERVWTSDSERSSETIRTCVKKLRDKIDAEGKPSIIKNIHGVGYKLETD